MPPDATRTTLKKLVVRGVKLLLPITILGWLVYTMGRENPDQLREILHAPKNWGRIGLALALCFSGVSCSFTRWYLLVRGLGVSFRWRDAYRLGFIGYFFNFVSLGAVGGDLFKMLFVLREQPGRRTEVVGSIVIDRVVGLYTLLLLASIAALLGQFASHNPELASLRLGIWIAFAIGTLTLACFYANLLSLRQLARWLGRFPSVALQLLRLEAGFQLYRRHKGVLMSAILVGVGGHLLHGCCLYLLATALFTVTPTLVEHYIMWPLAGAFSCLPMTPAGVGTFELALKELYDIIPRNASELLPQTGTIVGLSYRLLTMIVASVGVTIYWFRRAEVSNVMQTGETEPTIAP